MIRLYLDWNVISNMRKSQEGDFFFLLKKYLDENNSYFEIYYSHAHLSDLTGHKKILDNETKADLDFLSKLTENRSFSINQGDILYGKNDPVEWYKTIIEDSTLAEANTIDDLFKDIADDDSESSGLITSQLEQFKSIPIPEEMSRNLEFLFPESNCKTYYDITNAFIKMNKDWMSTDAYRNYRASLQELMNSNPNSISSSPNPFSAIDDNLKALGKGSSYSKIEQHIKESSEEHFKNTPSWFNQITSTYMNLDMHGYSQDEIKVTEKKKKTFHNTVNDATHTAFASMCHIYILLDKKARRKVTTTFQKLGVNTTILVPDTKKDKRFNSFVRGEFLKKPQTAQELFDSTVKILNTSQFTRETANNGEQKILTVYPACFFYGFFNKILVMNTEDAFQIILGTREPTNWRAFTAEELVHLTNQLLTVFGPADNGTKQIVSSELDEIQTNPDSKWALSWGSTLLLCVFSGRVQLYFPSIPFSKNEDTTSKAPTTKDISTVEGKCK